MQAFVHVLIRMYETGRLRTDASVIQLMITSPTYKHLSTENLITASRSKLSDKKALIKICRLSIPHKRRHVGANDVNSWRDGARSGNLFHR